MVAELICPVCGSNSYKFIGGYIVCTKCGTVIEEGVAATLLYIEEEGNLFSQYAKTKHEDLKAVQTFTIVRDFLLEERAKEAREINERYRKVYSRSDAPKGWYVVYVREEDALLLMRKTMNGINAVKAVVYFSEFPDKMKLIRFTARRRRGRDFYIVTKHEIKIDVMNDKRKRLIEMKDVVMRYFAEILPVVFAKRGDAHNDAASAAQPHILAYMLAYLLIRKKLVPSPAKWVGGKVVFREMDEVLFDGKPLSGKKAYHPFQLKDKEKAKKLKEIAHRFV